MLTPKNYCYYPCFRMQVHEQCICGRNLEGGSAELCSINAEKLYVYFQVNILIFVMYIEHKKQVSYEFLTNIVLHSKL